MNIRPALILVTAVLPLAACGGDSLTRTFGLQRESPDEFQVTTRAPLSVPPEMDLRPPRPGAERPQETSQRQQAEEAVMPQLALSDAKPAATTPGQEALLSQAGNPAPANIRNQVDLDAQIERGDRGFVDRLMFWKTPKQPGTIIDPQAEAHRLRTDAALGQAATTGDTPIFAPPKHGWLRDWLGF